MTLWLSTDLKPECVRVCLCVCVHECAYVRVCAHTVHKALCRLEWGRVIWPWT